MANLRFSSVALLAALSQLAPSLAQDNSTANDTVDCSSVIASKYATVNSTGRTAFRWSESAPNPNPPNGDPWYISVIVVDKSKNKTNPSANSMQRINFLSIPKDSVYDGACLMQLPGIKAKATGTGRNGCEGAISNTCLEYIRETMLHEGVSSARCPTLPSGASVKKDKREEECGHYLKGSAITTTKPINSTKQTCPLPNVPGFSPLENYYSINQGGMGDEYGPYGQGDDLAVYDSMFGDGEVVCVTPDDVADDSRVPPELEEPDKTSAVGSNWEPSALSAVFFAGFLSMFYAM